MARISILLITLAALLVPAPLLAVDGSEYCDLNGDGYDDLVAGDPGAVGSGQITIIYGSADRLDLATRQTISQTDIEPNLTPSQGPIGISFDCGDLDNDGYDDLVLGVPGASVQIGGLGKRLGAIYALYGAAGGVSTVGFNYYHRDISGVVGAGYPDAQFGFSIAIGNFDGDAFADVAVGAPSDDIGGPAGTDRGGSVHILYGKAARLGKARDRVFHRDKGGIRGIAKAGDNFGAALSIGDFNNDGYDDLAVGVPGADVDGTKGAGELHILLGTDTGLSAAGDKIIHRDSPGIAGTIHTNHTFGDALTSGDFDGDGYDDLVAGYEPKKMVHVIPGSPQGLSGNGDYTLRRKQPGVVGREVDTFFWGRTLSSGDLDGDSYDDLIVGSAADRIGGVGEIGSVHAFYGSPSGMSGDRDQRIHQGRAGIKGSNDIMDYFGTDTAVGDFDGNGRVDLATTSDEVVNTPSRIAVIYSNASGLSTADQSFQMPLFRSLGGSPIP